MSYDRVMTLKRLVERAGKNLNYRVDWADCVALLGALAEVESNFGTHAVPRYEKAYDFGGKYFNHDLGKEWGAWAACSYSSWQLMFPVAVELGFRGSPVDLHADECAIHWVVEYIDKRLLRYGCSSIEQFADGYNSGNFRDSFVPEAYVSKFVQAYKTVIDAKQLVT